METAPPAIHGLRVPHRASLRGWRSARPLGIGWRLGLGLAAVTAVLVASEILATSTTREALDAVRVMQNEHEPLASSANAVLEKLVAFDGVVGAFVHSRSGRGLRWRSRSAGGLRWRTAVRAYFGNRPQPPSLPTPAHTAGALTRHIARPRVQLASRATQRWQWVDARGGGPQPRLTSSSPLRAVRASPSMAPRYMRAARWRNFSPPSMRCAETSTRPQ